MAADKPTMNRRGSLRREQSLHKAFSAIHRSNSPPSSSGNFSKSEGDIHQQQPRNNGGANQGLKRRGRPNRRGSMETTSPPTPPYNPRRRASLPVDAELPSLPFPGAANSGRQDGFDRRYSPVTADMARDIVTKLTNDRLKNSSNQAAKAVSSQDKPSSSRRRPSRRVTVETGDAEQLNQLRRSVTFAQDQPQDQAQGAPQDAAAAAARADGSRQDYALGDALRSPSHMNAPSTPAEALQAVISLQKHDFAWVKRSDGSYSYAILAYRSFKPAKDASEEEECMTFVMSNSGSTKMVRRKHWADFVRLVAPPPTPAPQEASSHQEEQADFHKSADCVADMMFCQEVKEDQVNVNEVVQDMDCEDDEEEDWVPPAMIAFDAQEVQDEECSLLSSVSFRARLGSRRCK